MNIVLTLAWLLFAEATTGVRAVTSSHIEEMIKELVQPKDLEVSATDTISEGITTVTGELSSKSSLPKDLPSSDPQISKKIKILCILSFSSLLLLLMLWLQRVPG